VDCSIRGDQGEGVVRLGGIFHPCCRRDGSTPLPPLTRFGDRHYTPAAFWLVARERDGNSRE